MYILVSVGDQTSRPKKNLKKALIELWQETRKRYFWVAGTFGNYTRRVLKLKFIVIVVILLLFLFFFFSNSKIKITFQPPLFF